MRSLLQPVINPSKVKLIIVDSFCGCGGYTTGAESAVDSNGNRLAIVAVGVNHDAQAIEAHRLNHPETTHFVEDVRDESLPLRILAIVEAARLRYPNAKVLFHASLECFPAGTTILTQSGLKDIKDVIVGERVLTHTGSWKRVTATMRKVADTIKLKGHGHPGLETTEEHPFYARLQTRKWNNARRRWDYKEQSEPGWITAGNLTESKCRWATPVSYEPIVMPNVPGRGMDLESPDFWWAVGRWLGDGLSAPNRGGQVSIVCGNHEVEELTKRLSVFAPKGIRAEGSELRWQSRQLRTASIFYCSHLGLSTWLIEHFGRLSYGKTIPAWSLTMPANYRQALLDGYISADGHRAAKRTQATTVSKKLAIGIRLIAESLGYRCSLHEYESHNNIIEGRTVNVRNQWVVGWENNKSARSAFQDDRHAWSLVKSKETGRNQVEVFNLSVEDDESYVADGIVVHNCTNFSNAKGGGPRDADSRSLADCMPMYLATLQPDLFSIENVREFMAWGPLDEKGKPVSRTAGRDYQRWIRQVCEFGYQHDFRLLNSADFGAYTSRLRYFGLFTRPGVAAQWPAPTHARKPKAGKAVASMFGGLKPWKAVSDVLNFADRGESIFGRKKPLVEKSLERIYAGLLKHVGNGDESFMVKYLGNNAQTGINNGVAVNEPCVAVTTQNRLYLAQCSFLSKYYSGHPDSKNISVDGPAGTMTTTDSHALVSAEFLTRSNGGQPADRVQSVERPAHSITTAPNQQLVSAEFLSSYYGNGGTTDTHCPAGTVTTKDRLSLIQCERFIYSMQNNNSGRGLDQPAPTLLTGQHHYLMSCGFLSNPGWFGHSTDIDNPSPTLVARQDKAPVSVVLTETGLPAIVVFESDSPATVKIKHFMAAHGIIDITMRMLRVQELKVIQGFPADYHLSGNETQQKKFIGNAVEGTIARRLIEAHA